MKILKCSELNPAHAHVRNGKQLRLVVHALPSLALAIIIVVIQLLGYSLAIKPSLSSRAVLWRKDHTKLHVTIIQGLLTCSVRFGRNYVSNSGLQQLLVSKKSPTILCFCQRRRYVREREARRRASCHVADARKTRTILLQRLRLLFPEFIQTTCRTFASAEKFAATTEGPAGNFRQRSATTSRSGRT